MRIDSHTHIFSKDQASHREELAARDRAFAEMYADPVAKMADAPGLIAGLDAAGFDAAVAAGFAFSRQRDIDEQNACLLECAGERIIPFVTVNPTLPGWQRTLERAADGGARGIGELRPHNQGWDPLGPEGRALCAAAHELRLVLLWHVSEPLGHAYPGKRGGIAPEELIRLACAFPVLPMVGAHLGGGAASNLQMPEIFDTAKQLFFDTAAAFLLYDERCIARLADLVGPERVLFASDFPLLSTAAQADRVARHLSPPEAPLILGENARRLLYEHDWI